MIDEYKLCYTKTFNLLYTFKRKLNEQQLPLKLQKYFQENSNCNRLFLFHFQHRSTPYTVTQTITVKGKDASLWKDNLKFVYTEENVNAGNELFLALR